MPFHTDSVFRKWMGVIFLVLDHRVRYFHAAWHLFVLGSLTCHYFAILSFVVLPGRTA